MTLQSKHELAFVCVHYVVCVHSNISSPNHPPNASPPLALWNNHPLDRPNRRKVEANATLEDEESNEDESVVVGKDGDEEACAGDAEGVL